ncbi:MAG TPA: hypothetical protein VGG76_08110, partial [Gemmatimonadaceae bacterium]
MARATETESRGAGMGISDSIERDSPTRGVPPKYRLKSETLVNAFFTLSLAVGAMLGLITSSSHSRSPPLRK